MLSFLDPYAFAERYELIGKIRWIILGLIIFSGLLAFFPEFTVRLVFYTSPVWFPVLLFWYFGKKWMEYVQAKTFMETPRTLLEIRIPREVNKSPLAMEVVSNFFFHTGEPTHMWDKYIEGKLRPQFSLEICSFEGEIRFFIQTRAKLKNTIESQIYSQYPEVEVYEVEDYMDRFVYDPEKLDVWGIEQVLQKPDPLPIKTYVDFGLDKDPKEEFKVDPLSGVLEFLGQMGQGEYAFLQIVVRSHQAEKRAPGTWFKTEDWTAEAEREIQKIIEKLKVGEAKEGQFVVHRPPHEGEKMIMESIGRNIAKKPFDTGMRVMYLKDKERYVEGGPERNAGFPTMFRQFESHTLNGLKPKFVVNFPFQHQDPFGTRKAMRKAGLFAAYKARCFFNPPFKSENRFVLSSEELATLYHFPSSSARVPGLARIPSTKGEAPPNLPM